MVVQDAIQLGVHQLTERVGRDGEHRQSVSLNCPEPSNTPFLDTLIMLSTVLQMPQEEVLLYRVPLTQEEETLFTEYLEKRRKGLPIAYIQGKKEFYGREFRVTPDVLIPRPDTEILIEAVLEKATTLGMDSLAMPSPYTILDLCTGSGCVGITLQAELPHTEVTCVDLSEKALAICKENSKNLLPKEIQTLKSDLFTAVTGTFDIIATNPPYLTNTESDEIQHKGWNEPDMAFRGGFDGLDLIRTIVQESPKYLKKSGYLLIEAASEQGESIKTLMTQAGFVDILHYKDLSGAIRVTLGSIEKGS